MHWVLIALVAPLLWSLLNHADKYLISKYARGTGVGGLAILSSLFAFVSLPFIDAFHHAEIYSPKGDIVPLIVTGLLVALAVLWYLQALERDDASHVVPFWFLIPVIGYGLGIFLLGEHLEGDKLIGSVVTLAGAFILALEFDEGFSVKKKTVLLMIGSSVCLALSNVVFKLFAEETSFWHSIFWNQFGIGLFGLLCLLLIRKYRHDFVTVASAQTKAIIGLNLTGEVLQTIAVMTNYFAMLLAPVALVLLLSYTFQPFFVFIEGILLTAFFPHISKERTSRRHIIQKLTAMALMSLGVYLIVGA